VKKSEIPKRASTMDKSISTGIKYYLGLLYKRALFDLQFVHNLFWLKLKWNARWKLLLYLSFLHMKFKDIDKIKVAISETL
jgi:hypothetical protein